MNVRFASPVALVVLVAACAEPAEDCDQPFFDLEPQLCVVGSPCTIPLDVEGTYTLTGELPEGVTATDEGLTGTPTVAGTWPLDIEITSTTAASGDVCEPTTLTSGFEFRTTSRQCIDNNDCLVLAAGSFDRSSCTATDDCDNRFDHCVTYMDGGLCTASAECGDGLAAVSFTSVEGDSFQGCTRTLVCSDGLCN